MNFQAFDRIINSKKPNKPQKTMNIKQNCNNVENLFQNFMQFIFRPPDFSTTETESV